VHWDDDCLEFSVNNAAHLEMTATLGNFGETEFLENFDKFFCGIPFRHMPGE